jgi:hypothetical protein
MNTYEWLISRLDAFIRKYYANKVIRGSLVFLSCLLFYILTVSVSEYYLYLPVWSRVSIVSLFAILGSASLMAWVVIPLAKMARLGKVISHEQAANIIGTHFPEISDRLLNILQLKSQQDNHASRELAEASINQKISQISVIPITNAIDLSKNKKYLPYLLPLLLVGVFILVAAPNVFKESSSRLLQPTKAFEKPAPFQFVIKNPSLIAIRNSDLVLSVATTGSALPAEASIEIGSERIPMQPMENHTFQYTFKNVTEAVTFRFYAAGFYSSSNTLKVVQRPVLKAFKVQINYPAYTGKKDEVRNSLSDMTVPAGTTISWAFVTDHTDAATIRFGNGAPISLLKSASMFASQFRFMNDTSYMITLQNNAAGVADSFKYQVQVIPDQFPVIQLQQFKDTVSGKQVLLSGTAGDDYGITRVTFNYTISDKNNTVVSKSTSVKITPGVLTTFNQYVDILSMDLKPGQKLTYYIEAWDNDGVHGIKSSLSEVMSYLMYNDKQMDSAINENSKQINSGISNSTSKTQQLQSDYKDMQSKMLQNESMDWDQQQSLQEMMKKQLELKTDIENIKQRFDEQKQQSEQKKYSEELKDKQRELDKQLDNLLNNELKEQLKKLQELMQKLNKENAVEAMKQMEQENKLFKMDMERMKETYRQMEMEMRMEDLANKMDELAKKETELQKETEKKAMQAGEKSDKDKKEDGTQKGNDKNDKQTTGKDDLAKNGADKADQKTASKDDETKKGAEEPKGTANDKKEEEALMKKQKDIKDQMDKAMKEDMKEIEKLDKGGKKSENTQEEEQMGKDAQDDMQDSEDELGQGQKSKASKSQAKAAKKMGDMAKSLRKKAGGMSPDEIDIDIRATRQILSNLIRLSFDQEDLMQSVKVTSPTAQAYVNNQEEQNRLYRNSRMIKDSLFQLSKRIDKLSVTINKETSELEYKMKRTVDELEDRNINRAYTDQQYIMTHTNNLALMLNEVLANLMQMQAMAKKPGEGQPGDGKPCMKPGSNPKPGPGKQLSDIITEQKQLGESMQKMQKPGNKPGQEGQGQQGEKGQKGKMQGENGENGDAEQLARLAEQQASLRRKIQELSSELNSKGLGNSKELKEVEDKMDKNETDIVNRKMTPELLRRQKDIETRMLEVEKSLREQEQDDKRSSNAAKEISRPVPPALQKYITDQKQLLELYKTVPPQLKPYYREMVEHYFHIINPTP